MMTRKDYVTTAKIFSDYKNVFFSLGVDGENLFENLVGEFGAMFENDNPSFDDVRFDNACWGKD